MADASIHASAALDRLTHRARTLVIRGAGCRQRTHGKESANHPTAASPDHPPRLNSEQTT